MSYNVYRGLTRRRKPLRCLVSSSSAVTVKTFIGLWREREKKSLSSPLFVSLPGSKVYVCLLGQCLSLPGFDIQVTVPVLTDFKFG